MQWDGFQAVAVVKNPNPKSGGCRGTLFDGIIDLLTVNRLVSRSALLSLALGEEARISHR